MKNLQINLKGLTKNITTRSEVLHGVEYIVAPVTMIVEGVLPGSGGPIMYTANEIAASVMYWDGVPVTINHPTDSDGLPVSARTPSVIEEFSVGQIWNTSFDATKNSLKAEAWINKALLEEKFPNVLADINSDDTNMEISTGVFFDDRGEPGNFNGIAYNSVAYSYHGDHLALLPNDVGACSWTDGCGLRANSSVKNTIKKEKKVVFNELSFSSISGALHRYVDAQDNNEYIYYTDAIYNDYFTFEKIERSQERKRTLWKQSYTNINDIVTPTGTPQRVIETRTYTIVSDDATQPSGISTNNIKKESDMPNDNQCCPEKVKSLIAANTNTFTEDNKDFLLTLNEKQLESATLMSEKDFASNSANTNNTDTRGEELQTTEDFVKTAPSHIQNEINELLAKREAEKQLIVDNILKDDNCVFTKEELITYEINVLEKMAALAKKEPKNSGVVQEDLDVDMTANAGSQTNEDLPGEDNALTLEDTLQVPKINWIKE